MNNIELFFTSKYFVIPNYQRDYAWTTENIDDLFEDIFESIETNTSHYIGTFILSKKENENFFKVVDGQQRLTTITMIINAIILKLTDDTQKIINKDKFIISNNIWRLKLLNENNNFFINMLSENIFQSENKSQKLLEKAYGHIKSRIDTLSTRNLTPSDFLNALKKLEIMEFLEKDDGKAIRIFQTVNDRGKPLSNMEKAKSLLIYYSNRFLEGKLDEKINENFGLIFKIFNSIKGKAEEYSISLISQRNFNEDSVMRYHFLAFDNEHYDYNATVNDVLEIFLKSNLKNIKVEKDKLENFISRYINDMLSFFNAFKRIMDRINQIEYYKLFSIQDISAFLYPLLIRLEEKEILEKESGHFNYSYLKLIGIADLRVYKTRGTDPSRDVSFLAKDIPKITTEDITNRLVGFINNFMSNNEFKNRLESDIYGNRALKSIFIGYDEYLKKNNYSIDELVQINNTVPTVEHIFPQEAPFAFPNNGFNSINDYLLKINKIGNLLLLEENVNSACKNRVPEIKITDDKFYEKSTFKTVIDFYSKMRNRRTSFIGADIDYRTQELSNFVLEQWKM